ncbi:MAG TPA: DUF6067 family protein [Planctomycetota bacterium]|nr:DUF6067 family protein [Planctomycetota bacterium]
MVRFSILPAVLCCLMAPAAVGEPPILSEESVWRASFKMDTPVVRSEAGLEPCRASHSYKYGATACASPQIPAGWNAPEFDDSEWPHWQPAADRGRKSQSLFIYGFDDAGAPSPGVSGIYMRGRFLVADPAGAGNLKLSLAYRGGAAVYLNGKEITRDHLPKGELTPETVAEDYPAEAFFKDNKQPIQANRGDPEKCKDQLEKRVRSLEVSLDGKLLKAGVNVLAIELRRAPYPKNSIEKDGLNYMCSWGTCGLVSLALSGAKGVSADAGQPQGVRVWNRPTGQELSAASAGNPGGVLHPIRLAGARNGAFSGQVVVSSPAELKGVKVVASDLKSADGGSPIPAAAIQVRYSLAEEGRFNGLDDAPGVLPAIDKAGGAAAQPVWATVRVPRDAKPGRYAGKLTIEANGQKAAEVPLEISVADWTIPDPKEFPGFIDVIDSPETLALKYKVPMWSEEHWKLLDRNFELMGGLGAKCLYLLLLPGTYFGNEHSMVHSMKQPDGSYQHDFSALEKYLDAALKHMRPEVVVVDLWDRRFGMVNYTGRADQQAEQDKGVAITLKDPATGKLSIGEGPKWGTPEAREFWKPVVEGLKERLAKRGLGKALVWGLASDRRPRKETVEDLKALAPEVEWSCHAHPYTGKIHGQRVGYLVHVWGSPQINFNTIADRKTGWETDRVIATFPRMSSGGVGAIYDGTSPLKYRAGIEGMMICGYRGLGRVGGEFWDVAIDAKGRAKSVLRTTPDVGETWGIGFEAAITQIFAAGRNGPVATARSEMFRENQQEIAARVLLEKALKDPAQKARLGEALAAKCQGVLDERGHAMVAGGASPNWLYYQQGLRERAERLFAAAAEVAAKAGR